MSTRYLEINSAYRNRIDYPKQSEFEIISGNYTEEFPQLTSFPIYTFYNNGVASFLPAFKNFTNTSRFRPSLENTPNLTLFGTAYAGYHLYAYSDAVPGTPPPTDDRTVVSMRTTGDFILDSPLSIIPDPDPTSIPKTYALLLDISPLKDASDPDNPATYLGPQIYYNVQVLGKYNQKPSLIASPYVGYYLMNDSNYGTPNGKLISSFNTDSLTLTIETPLSSVVVTNKAELVQSRQFSIRKSLPLLRGSSSTPNANGNIVTLDVYASSQDDVYKGMYLYLEPNSSDPSYPIITAGKNTFAQYVYKIIKYVGATKEAYLDRRIDPGVGAASGYEIMVQTESSWNPLIYTGSSVVRPDPICMRVGLTALILPNVILNTGTNIAFYPFVYVELRNASSSKTVGKDIIYSNNPNSHSAIFVVPITDIRNPRRAPFIKLKSKMRQTIKFKPNDSFIFRVYLPNGDPFITYDVDNTPPLPANPMLQIEAVFNYTPV